MKHGEIVPVHSIVAEMSSVTLYAGSPTNVSWIFPSYVAHPYRHLKLPRQLILNNLVEDDSGFYTCFGMFSDGKMFFSLGYIEVYKKPDPGVLVPYPLVVASVGGSVKLIFLSFYSNALVLLNKTNRRFDHSTVAIISVMVIFDTKKNDLRM